MSLTEFKESFVNKGYLFSEKTLNDKIIYKFTKGDIEKFYVFNF